MSGITHLKCPACGKLRSATEQFAHPAGDTTVELSLEEEVALTLAGRVHRSHCSRCTLDPVNVRRVLNFVKKTIRRDAVG